MKKLIPCMLAGLIITGLFALCITSFLAPSANYILDNLEPVEDSEEPFYFTLNPISQTIELGNPTFLSAHTNLSDVSFSWEYILLSDLQNGTGSWRSPTSGLSFDGGFYVVNSGIRTRFYRCVATSGDRTIYSSPAMINIIAPSGSSSQSSLLKSDLEEFEKDVEFEDFEKTEVIEESEVIE